MQISYIFDLGNIDSLKDSIEQIKKSNCSIDYKSIIKKIEDSDSIDKQLLAHTEQSIGQYNSIIEIEYIEQCCYILHFKLTIDPEWQSELDFFDAYQEEIIKKYISTKYNHQQNKPSCAWYNFGSDAIEYYDKDWFKPNIITGQVLLRFGRVAINISYSHIFAYDENYLFYTNDYSKHVPYIEYWLNCYDDHIAYRIVPLLTMFCNKKHQSQYWLKRAYQSLSWWQKLLMLPASTKIKNNLDNLWRFHQKMVLFGYIEQNFKQCKNNIFDIGCHDQYLGINTLINYQYKNKDYLNCQYQDRLETKMYNDMLKCYKDLYDHCTKIIEESYSFYILIEQECKYIESQIQMINIRIIFYLTALGVFLTVLMGVING